ncbi:HNH endonuclease, partial [Psychrobacter aquimaris]|uniref:HNH endonuclease n=1 Tax=Psychrobacter aquimaris TaxID=292733 RepID=UPI001868005F
MSLVSSLISAFVLLVVFSFIYGFVMTVLYPMVIDLYFKRAKFLTIKAKVTSHIEDCNELNDHIEHLKLSYVDIESFDYGTAQLVDTSLYNMNRPQWVSDSRDRRTHLCSSSVATSASNQPYKYLCKYFNVEPNEETLEKFEQVLNDFSAVEQGKHLLAKERDEIIASVSSSISTFMMKHHLDRVTKELGFHKISLSNVYFPVYTFKYVSAAGKSGFETPIQLDIKGLEGFIKYLANLIKFKNSIAGQRALMTVKLRERIKRRDNYSCQICTLSTSDEANLLLEIDHIIPLSKGGITAEDNLQTLCWKCNRTKGSKIYNNEAIPHSVLTSPAKSDVAWPPRANTSA